MRTLKYTFYTSYTNTYQLKNQNQSKQLKIQQTNDMPKNGQFYGFQSLMCNLRMSKNYASFVFFGAISLSLNTQLPLVHNKQKVREVDSNSKLELIWQVLATSSR